MAVSVFERYGGFAVVSKVVLSFYDHVLDSDRLAPYFESVDMRRLIDHQTKFVAAMMGGPASISDRRLREVHAHLAIDEASFDEMVALMRETLEDFEFEAEDIESVLGEIRAREPLIVARPR
ncbi:MAG: group 1 truncated hemoglobin [Azospirillaceae bacterium]